MPANHEILIPATILKMCKDDDIFYASLSENDGNDLVKNKLEQKNS